MNGNGQAAQEAAARKEFETGEATRAGRLELRKRAILARRELVRNGGIPKSWIDAQEEARGRPSEEARGVSREFRERRELATRFHLSVWLDSAREEFAAMRAVLERRELGARRPMAAHYFESEVMEIRFPHVEAQWQYQRSNFGRREMVAMQRMGLRLAYVRGDELPADMRDRVQERMVQAAVAAGCEQDEAELLARQHYLLADPLIPVETKPGLNRMDRDSLDKLKEKAAGTEGERERRMLQGWINPSVDLGLDCTVFGVMRQDRDERGSGYSTGELAGFSEEELAEAYARLEAMRLPALSQWAMRNLFTEMERGAGSDQAALAMIGRMKERLLHELARDSADARVRAHAEGVGLCVVMREQAGLADVVMDQETGYGRVVPRQLLMSRAGLMEGLEGAMEGGRGRYPVSVAADGSGVSNTRPRIGAYCGDFGAMDGRMITGSRQAAMWSDKRLVAVGVAREDVGQAA